MKNKIRTVWKIFPSTAYVKNRIKVGTTNRMKIAISSKLTFVIEKFVSQITISVLLLASKQSFTTLNCFSILPVKKDSFDASQKHQKFKSPAPVEKIKSLSFHFLFLLLFHQQS